MKQGDKLKALCRERKVSIREMSDKIGVSRVYLHRLLKKDYLPTEVILRSCEILNVPMWVLFDGPSSVTVIVTAGTVDEKADSIEVSRDGLISVIPQSTHGKPRYHWICRGFAF